LHAWLSRLRLTPPYRTIRLLLRRARPACACAGAALNAVQIAELLLKS
jgi:hypothetical protein